MGWLRARSYQDWLLTLVSLVTVAFVAHIWVSETPRPSVAVINSVARQIRETDQWAIQFVFHNRGEAPASGLRLRLATANLRAPEMLQLSDDFALANDLDPGGDIVRVLNTPRPPQPAAAAAPEPAKPVAPAAAGGRGAAAAAPPAPLPAPPREPQGYIFVLQADYPSGSPLGGAVRKRWYYFYREGDAVAVQVGEAVKQRVAQAADGLLR